MRTAMLSPCFLDGLDPMGSSRLERNVRFVEYYRGVSKVMDVNWLFLTDNASDYDNSLDFCRRTGALTVPANLIYPKFSWPGQPFGVTFIAFEESLKKTGKGGYDYSYCWRSLFHARELIEAGYSKIVFMDSDGFVVSHRLAAHIRDLRTGWESFWCKKWGFPEASIHVLCEDAFSHFMEFTKGDFREMNGLCMETTLPFTKVNRDFECDRYGEDKIPQRHGMDFYGQHDGKIPIKFIG